MPLDSEASTEKHKPETLPLETLYAEYVRLSGTCHDYVNSALSDIRLFGAMGALITWDPLSQLLDLDSKLNQPVTPVGFIVLLLATGMVMFYDLFKQSIFFFHMSRMREFERVLNAAAADLSQQRRIFDLAGGWTNWFRQTHMPIARGFFALFYLILIGLPSAILYFQEYLGWLLAYLTIAAGILLAHARIADKVINSLESGQAAD